MKYLTFIFFIASYNIAFCQGITPDQAQRIDSVVRAYINAYRIQGLSLSLVRHNAEIMVKGYGYTNVDTAHTVTPNTSFLSCSVTKLFTATAIMQLVEQGRIKLDEKLISYLPSFTMRDKRYKDITIRHLLTHSSGLNWHDELNHEAADSTALRELVHSLHNKKLNFAPGTQFSGETYSNTAYNILGYVVEQLSGRPYDVYVREYILRKVGMDNSTFNHADVPISGKSMPIVIAGSTKEIRRFNMYGEVKDINPILKYSNCKLVAYTVYGEGREQNPCGNLNTTAADLAKWMQHCLSIHIDSLNRNGVLKHSTLENMWTMQRSISNKNTSMGLGWWRYNSADKGNYVFHVGNDPGFSAVLILYPHQDIGIAILSNAMYAEDVVWNKIPQAIAKILAIQ